MSFSKLPSFTVEHISARVARITGLNLGPLQEGTIGFASHPLVDVALPARMLPPVPCAPLPSSVKITIGFESSLGLTNLPPSVSKSGETEASFTATITNTNNQLTTQDLEIYVEILG